MARARLDADAIVAAAAVLADAEGLTAVTLARLATELGVRSPSLYAHIGGLDDLRRRLGARGASELAATLGSAAQGRAGADALGSVAAAYRAYALDHPGTYSAAQQAPDPGDPETSEAARQAVDVVLAVLRGYGFDGEDAIHAARTVRAALHGFVALELEGGFGIPVPLDESYRWLVGVLDHGLRRAAERAPQSAGTAV